MLLLRDGILNYVPRYQINYELIWKVSVNSVNWCATSKFAFLPLVVNAWFECGRICLLESSFMLIRHIPKYVDGIHLFAYTQISLFAMISYMLSMRRACKSVKAFKPPDHSIDGYFFD